MKSGKLRIGHHLSISGSLEKAALRAVAVGANTLQIFSASPRMWRAGVPDRTQVMLLQRAREKYDLRPLVIHDNYLINMASCDEGLRAQSVAAFRAEIERALTIGAEYLVAHPGNCKGHGVEMGLHTFCVSLGEAAAGLDTRGLTVLIENTAGSGSALGSRFEELVVLKQHAPNFTGMAIGFCIDTCHCLAAGYDVATEQGLKNTLDLLDRMLGFDHIPVFHANDSKTPLGSRVDRHAHIGKGFIGAEAFRRILRHPKLQSKAFIAETPAEGEEGERRTVQELWRLSRAGR